MVDIHSHILFGVDDGAKELANSLTMLGIGIEEGIHTFFLTPHLYTYDEEYLTKIRNHFKILKDEVITRDMNCRIYLANEIHFTHQILDIIKNPQICYDTNPKVFLLEFPFDVFPMTAIDVLKVLTERGFAVIIAHPERNGSIIKNYKIIDRLKQIKNVYLQVTAASIIGHNGRAIQKITKKMLKNGHLDFVASDCHNLFGRSFFIKETREFIVKNYGEEVANRVFKTNQEKALGLS